MAITTLIRGLRKKLSVFRAAQGGNIVITFTLLLIPIIGLVGAAVDYSRAGSARAAMQGAIDSTALMLSKDAATLTAEQVGTKATSYFNALFNRTEVSGIQVTPVYTTSGGSQIVVTGTGNVPTTFMKVMGFSTINLSVSSTVKWGNTRLRIALVLDNTGSMSSANKMTALKTATHNLLTQLKNAAGKNGDVYVSIIPFSKDVNVDRVNYSQTWVRWDLWDAVNRSSGGAGNNNNGKGNGVPADHNTWNGCVTDRDQDYDTKNTAPSIALQATLFPAEQYTACPVPMMGLSYDWTALNNKVDAMQPNGNTNQAIGLQSGYQSLTSAPFVIPAKDSNFQYKEVIILLTDGLNTGNRWGTSQTAIDTRQQITCSNVKAAGIIIYTVQVNTAGDPTSALLQNCASTSDKFFLLTSSTGIVTTFNQIATALTNLRVAK